MSEKLKKGEIQFRSFGTLLALKLMDNKEVWTPVSYTHLLVIQKFGLMDRLVGYCQLYCSAHQFSSGVGVLQG